MTDILIREITHVDELDGVFRVRFDYIKEWKDHNLKFKNLHENIINSVRHGSLKTLTWHSSVVFKGRKDLYERKEFKI